MTASGGGVSTIEFWVQTESICADHVTDIVFANIILAGSI